MTHDEEDLLLGHLIGANDPADEQAVLRLLAERADAQAALVNLKRLLAPLESDRIIVAPPGLAERTIGRALATKAVPRSAAWDHRSRSFSRWDAAISACIAVLMVGIGVSVVGRVRSQYALKGCQENLRQLHFSLEQFADNREGKYPKISDQPPYNRGGSYVPILAESGTLKNAQMVRCPSLPKAAVPMEQEGDFAYALGHRIPTGELVGLDRLTPNRDVMPLVADLPPASRHLTDRTPSHGNGGNVLFLDGNVRFCNTSFVGPNGDHIFLNQKNRVSAGLNPSDAVLGGPNDCP